MIRKKQLETVGGFSEKFGRLKLATILVSRQVATKKVKIDRLGLTVLF